MTKKLFNDSIWFMNGLMLGAAAVLIAMAVFSNWVSAATYNVMFNNVEQGANGVANPRVDVRNGKATKTADAAAKTDETSTGEDSLIPPSDEARPSSAVAASEANESAVAPKAQDPYRKVRMGFLANTLSERTLDKDGKVGGTFSLGVFPLKDFGVNAYIGSPGAAKKSFYGAELEFIPIRAGIFGWKDALEVKAIVGANTIGKEFNSKPASFYGGTGATVNFGDRYGVTAAVRTNLTNRTDYRYWLADAGLVVRF